MNHASHDPLIGINWGSSNFRAYRIGADGAVEDTLEAAAGVATLKRDGMIDMAARLQARWPDARRVIAAGMIGSNIGWADAGYAQAPAGLDDIAAQLVPARIGVLDLHIVPGVTCVRTADGAPDVMRGEETELFGLLASGQLEAAPVIALPGTHTKWVAMDDGRIGQFMTAMSGEMHDRMTSAGVLASVVAGASEDGPAFREGVRVATTQSLGLGTLLFGVRARVIRGVLPLEQANGYLRGLLIGAEIADALALFPALKGSTVPLVGAGPVCALYRAALEELGIGARFVASADAVVRGFIELAARQRVAKA
ncbi:2-dehydro-3-deoxygalactonokinase [Pseudoxanthomonas sp. GM95]|uniref:2-dehydro-3-deoxygalactonokinase n=1 Tax=Pseudoxanthomonas sp. GM95 TaxID=1881043 RepID=UPI0008C03F2D|nr:2-dehydro-3-deoxygalactonokinase [Pseudoxanthomonas sp. GM95]SEL60271.1 2-dehydro-3-deoxygalactonokinase [Pseudoxanthomonas sp. GM95]